MAERTGQTGRVDDEKMRVKLNLSRAGSARARAFVISRGSWRMRAHCRRAYYVNQEYFVNTAGDQAESNYANYQTDFRNATN